MVLESDNIVEACKEWIERHYGIISEVTPIVRGQIGSTVYVLGGVSAEFSDVSKRSGSPYRDPGSDK